MRIPVGIACSLLWLLYLGQLVSVLNFGLAQRLGLQEKPEGADPVWSRLELWTARWDILWLWTLPLAGVLMLADHACWPYAALVGGGAVVDTGGREAAKIVGLMRHEIRVGSRSERRLLFGVHAGFVIVGVLAIVAALLEVR